MSTSVALYRCRLCLNKTPTRVKIFSGDFPRMLDTLTSVKVHEEDGLPKYSCIKCIEEVQMALIVKNRIIKAHELLVEALKQKRAMFQRLTKEEIKKKNQIQPKLEVVEDFNEDSNDESVTCDESIDTVETELDPLYTNKEEKRRLGHNVQSRRYTVQKYIKITRFTCEKCNLNFSDRRTFTMHNRKHEKRKCDICSRLIRTDNMKKHVLMHTAGPSVCSLCGVTCKNFESLRCHNFHYHKHNAQQYVCEECGKGFRMKYRFLLHKKKAHMGLKNFKCTTCGKAFFTNGTLLKHVRMTHEKLRPYVCEYCGTGFSSRYALTTHKRKHTNEKPFVCQHCSEGFKQRVSLRSHLKSKHGIEEAKEFFCKTCEKGFATDYALSIHERLHEMKKCGICSENFAGDEYLANHLREIHHVEVEIEQDT
ncbi:histone-lysine N-methyltransferase PRDM9-like [Diabrotica virgifera virgifera]|uniref:Uncharacterized protein n=1 Tax=Diabrotica virgifera virgifera TaxID=50390 RepID=A0ABM5K9A7_DIAVI|nr:histone-lysine N-methyltransferase PRDM9-like [Diabrotica virgifera virgifera]